MPAGRSLGLTLSCPHELMPPCTVRAQLKFIEEWKGKGAADVDSQIHRLNGMAASGMRAELKGWVLQRLAILKQVSPEGKAEL